MEEKKEDIHPDESLKEGKGDPDAKPKKHHWIHPAWLRITLKTIMWIIIAVCLIPFILYIPPVQTLVKNIACNVVEKSTGMKIGIDKFRLKWPLDVSLKGVTVIEADGDTMVYAKEVIADVKMAPLFKLEVDVNKLELKEAGFNMLSPDSSLSLKVKAGLLEVDDKTTVDIKTLDINLNKVYLKNGNLSLVMDVWKQQKTPQDTTATTPLTINMHDIQLDNFGFEMSMLPTIDTLTFRTKSVTLRNGVVDLEKNIVKAQYLAADDGDVVYIAPTPEYVASHPVPLDTVPSNAPPMIIDGDTVSISGIKALYAIKGAKPLPGFDPSYIEVSNVAATLNGFYNAGPSIKLPITFLEAKERSGLQITSGSGTISIDSVGIGLKNLDVKTLYSDLYANADIPFSLMELKPYARIDLNAEGSIGLPDVEAFMPAVKDYTSKIPTRTPLNFNIEASGILDNVTIPKIDVAMPGIFSVNADGHAANLMDFKQLNADVVFKGSVSNPGVVDNIVGLKDIKFPKLTLEGKASAAKQNYTVDFNLKTTMGNLAADGNVNLTSESYKANVNVHDIDVSQFMPDLGIGKVSANLYAKGAGFNPVKAGASTDIRLDILSIYYNSKELKDISADVKLKDHAFALNLDSPNDEINVKLKGDGTLAPDLYTFDITAIIDNVDLEGLGISKDYNSGRAIITLAGSASPEKWLYDADLTVRNLEWTLGNDFYDFPGNVNLKFLSTFNRVSADLTAKGT